jgi:hypothetical protein
VSLEHDAIDFVADVLRSARSPHREDVRWWCLRDDLKEEARKFARKTIAGWAQKERATAAEVAARRAEATFDPEEER